MKILHVLEKKNLVKKLILRLFKKIKTKILLMKTHQINLIQRTITFLKKLDKNCKEVNLKFKIKFAIN